VNPAIRHIVLVGLMGSGKTTVGAALARTLGWPYRDSDAEIEARAGLTSRAIAARDGIEALHVLERDQLLEAVADPTRTVVSAAASTIDDAFAREVLIDPAIRVVWLRGLPATLARRLSASDHRPDFGPDLEAVIAEQSERRAAGFQAVADVVIDIDDLTPTQVVERLLV
jgi:shikimate kinase